jgi:hypothetical protein
VGCKSRRNNRNAPDIGIIGRQVGNGLLKLLAVIYTFAENNLTDREAICHGFSHKVFDDFSDDKLQTLKELAWNLKRDEAVNRHNELIHDYSQACEYATADYLREKILTAKARNPKNLYAYVTKILENERKKK